MGQKVSRLSGTWSELMEEKNRVLHLSSEILARVDDNVKNEDIFLVDYDNTKIDAKIDRWMENHKHEWQSTLSKFPQEFIRKSLEFEVIEVADDLRYKMRKDYQAAYARMKKCTRWIDAIGVDERKLHSEIQNLAVLCQENPELFATKFEPLRKRVYQNLQKLEKLTLEEKKLRAAFKMKISKIDQKCMEECASRIDGVIQKFTKNAETLQ